MKLFPPFRLDAADQSLWRGNQRVPLTPRAFAVLNYLVERSGRLVTQDELLEALWPDTFVQPEVLKSQILDVRAALGDRPKEPLFIETVPRRGYRFIAPVSDGAGLEAGQASDGKKLVGRDEALQELRVCLRRSSTGERQVVFVTGEPGMGKTSVLEAFLNELRRDNIRFALGQCLEGYGGATEPYYAVLDALGNLSRGLEAETLIQILELQAPTWLIQLPALVKREHRETLQRELAGATRERMIREICEALEILTAERSLVLLFEDLHWADHSTVDLISAIARRRSPARLLVLGTYRPVDIVLSQHPLKQMSHALKAHSLCSEIMLSPLAETDIAQYLGGRLNASVPAIEGPVGHLAQWIRKQTEGNPLFMVTVIEHLEQLGHIARDEETWKIPKPLDEIRLTVPDTLRQMIELQIEMLSPREQLVLGAGSVQGMVFSASVTATVVEIEVESVEDTCQKLARHQHIIRDGGVERFESALSQKYEFVHALFQSVLYQRLAPARRTKLHHRFGEAIEARFSSRRADAASELAGHFEQAGDWLKTVDYLRLAVRNAWRRFAYSEAISTAEHALKLTERLPDAERIAWEMQFREMLAVLVHASWKPSRALPILELLSSRAAEYGMADVEARSLMYQVVMRASGDARACLPLMDRLWQLTSEHKGPLAICSFGWNAQLAKEHAESLAEVRRSGDRLSIASQQMDHSYVEFLSSRYADCVQHAQESLPLLLEGGQVMRYLLGRDLLALGFLFQGEWGKALDVLDESITNAEKNVAPHRMAMPLLFKAWVHLNAMDYQGTLDMCTMALPSLEDPFNLDRRYLGLRIAAAAEMRMGQLDEALAKLLELRERMERHPVTLTWYWQIPLQLDVVDAYLTTGNSPAARLEANRMIDLTFATMERTWQTLACDVSARVALQEQDSPRAESDLKKALETMEGFHLPLAAWRVHTTAARLSRLRGDVPSYSRHRTSAREIVRSLTKSLDSRPSLQKTFLSSPEISELLADESNERAAPASG